MKRNSNIELLRIILALLIVAHHYGVHGMAIYWNYESIPTAQFFVDFISMFGKLAVDVFIIITGYFMVDKKFKFKRVFSTIFEVYFYSIGIYLLSKYLFNLPVTSEDATVAFNPIIKNNYWFATNYIYLLISSFIINIVAKRVPKKLFLGITVLCLLVFCVYPIPGYMTYREPDHFIWMNVMYMVGASIKLFDFKGFKNNKYNFVMFAIISLVIYVCWQLGNIYYIDHKDIVYSTSYPTNLGSPLVVMASIMLFVSFNNMVFKNSLVNNLAKTSLGIYLIHDNPIIRRTLWNTWFNCGSYAYSGAMIVVNAIVVISVVFIVSMLIDLVRVRLESEITKLIRKCNFNN